MLSLTYVSSATELLEAPRLLAMLADWRPRNQALGLTGMLLHSGGNIIQTLEGPDEAVDAIFATSPPTRSARPTASPRSCSNPPTSTPPRSGGRPCS